MTPAAAAAPEIKRRESPGKKANDNAGFCKEDKEENYVNPDPIGLWQYEE